MWRQISFVLTLTLSTLAIRVPVDGNNTETTTTVKPAEKKQDASYVSDGGDLDSYLLPPDPHRPEDLLHDTATPATYLLPPSPDKQIDYYAPTEGGEQTDWYPIAPDQIPSTPVKFLPPAQSEAIPIITSDQQSSFEVPEQSHRGGKAYAGGKHIYQLPSRQLEPPDENAANDYTIEIPSEEQELPAEEINHQFNSQSEQNDKYNSQPEEINNQHDSSSEEINHHYNSSPHVDYEEYQKPIPNKVRKLKRKPKKNILRINPAEPTLALHLTPPKLESSEYKVPTKIYPKKVNKGFYPVSIPIGQYAEDTPDVPRAKPVKPLKPVPSDEIEYFTPLDEKRIYLFEQAQKKRLLKGERAASQQQHLDAAGDTYGDNAPTEPETSETNYRHPARNVYGVRPAHLYQARLPSVKIHSVPLYQAPAPLHYASGPHHHAPGLLHHAPGPLHHAAGPLHNAPAPLYPSPAPLRQAERPQQSQAASTQHDDEPTPPPPGDRTEFRMHGMKGPHSYQFGYDTGKGKNRQFRYEERDNDGRVKGHYGYMDKSGKLRVVNYDADPEHGFHAEAPVEKE